MIDIHSHLFTGSWKEILSLNSLTEKNAISPNGNRFISTICSIYRLDPIMILGGIPEWHETMRQMNQLIDNWK